MCRHHKFWGGNQRRLSGRVCTAGAWVAYKSPDAASFSVPEPNINLQERSNENGRENKDLYNVSGSSTAVWTALGPAMAEDCFKHFVSQLRFSSFAVQVMGWTRSCDICKQMTLAHVLHYVRHRGRRYEMQGARCEVRSAKCEILTLIPSATLVRYSTGIDGKSLDDITPTALAIYDKMAARELYKRRVALR